MSSVTPAFSGWKVLAGCFIVMFFIQGGSQSFPIFMPSIVNDTGFSLSEIAMISTVGTIAAFVSNLSLGILFNKIGAKWILFIGGVFSIASYFIYSYSHTLLGLYTAAASAGLAVGYGTVAPLSVIITNWFIKKRSTYISIVIAGSMFGSAVIMPACGQLIEYFGWRMGYRILGASILLVFLAIIFLIIENPQKKGQLAYGENENTSAVKNPEESTEVTGVPLEIARASSSFWLLLAGILLIGCSTNIENFLPAFWQSKGLSVAQSSNIMGIYALITAVAAIALGRISDKLGGTVYAFLVSVMFILGTLTILFIGVAATPILIITIVPFAMGAKKTSTLTPPLVVSATFGRKHYGAIIGYFTGTLQLGIALSNPIIGSLYHTSGGYQLPFTTMAAMNGVAFILIFAALRLSPLRKSSLSLKAKRDHNI